METVISILTLKILKTVDRDLLLIFHRISITCKNHTYCGIILEFQIDLIQGSVNACLHNLEDIILHTRKNNLCLRISESGIVLQNLRSVCSEHQAKENDSLKGSSLCCHCIHSRLIYIFSAEFIYLVCIERAWGKCSHSAFIQTLVTILCTLVILCGCHGTDSLSIYKRKYRNLTSCHEFLDDHGISGTAELFILHDLLHPVLSFFKVFADQHTLSKGKTVSFENNGKFCLGS